MTNIEKIEIAKSFPSKFAEAELNLQLTESEFGIFESGIYSRSMDEKWNIFLIEDHMYWARAWTNHCIYKVQLQRQNNGVELKNIEVSREPSEYESQDLEYDIGVFKRMLEFYLKQN